MTAVASSGFLGRPTPRSRARPGGGQSEIYVPPGWPERVRPPGAPDWERTATAFLLDCCPPEFRQYGVLRRHPIVLARFAAVCVEAQVQACATGLAQCRAGLDGMVPPSAIDEAAEAWHEEAAALRRVGREVALVEESLRGRVFVRRL